MKESERGHFSGPVAIFHEKRLPEVASPAGYSALIDAFDLSVPLPRRLYAIGEHHRVVKKEGWLILTPRHAPRPTLEGHLTFALKHEGLDLAVLKRLFRATGPTPIETLVRKKPTGSYARRIWFLYEWLTDKQLNHPDASDGRYSTVVNPHKQWTIAGETSRRHRLKNNLPGTREFCPMVFRTNNLNRFTELNLPERAKKVINDVPGDLLARTAAFLLLKDSKSSYAIEGESPPQDRIQRWGRAIGEAGRQNLDLDELLRLQKIVIGDTRFIDLGLRLEDGFVGTHDRHTHMPLPGHISARPENLPSLVEGMVAFVREYVPNLDPVMAAAVLAFGFVYTHPFEDGNGRVHRYLIHHVLTQRGFNPPGVVFPVSAAILESINEYRQVLEDYSSRLMPLIEWEQTKDGNVHVLNETHDFYRYFDATPHVEFLFRCVQKTIDEDLPNETDFLRCYDLFKTRITSMVDMPANTIDLLFRFLQQNDGRLSMRAREREFKALTADETAQVEEIYGELFSDLST
ncbi:MAG: Fic family protein [Deltaproteobacteria bacterium]|nr:Fic family protein [Deltaproteobacteria bacterium]